MGSFSGIQIGATGLNAQRRGVDTAGQNIANVNTEGYTRQRVDITADSGPVTPAFHSRWNSTGLGVRSVDVTRLRDGFIDSRMRNEAALEADLGAKAAAYTAIERIFNEPSDTGLGSVLADFVSSWDDLANNPGDAGTRTQVVERGVTLADDINQIGRALDTLRDANRTKLETSIKQVNADAAQVAKLQETIKTAQAAGTNANELQDERDLLLEKITTAVGGTVRYEDDGTATLYLGGTALVRGDRSVELEVQHAEDAAGNEVTSVVWALDDRAADVGGAAAGALEVVNSVIPSRRQEMVELAQSLRSAVNAVHTAGFDKNGAPGGEFFAWDPDTLEISVNADVRSDPARVAASAVGPDGGNLDVGNTTAMVDQLAGIDASYRELIVDIGVQSQAAQRREQLQGNVVAQVRAEQESANGVNLDEEMSDLVRFQRAYEASARFISSVDEMLNTLINGTGRVGR